MKTTANVCGQPTKRTSLLPTAAGVGNTGYRSDFCSDLVCETSLFVTFVHPFVGCIQAVSRQITTSRPTARTLAAAGALSADKHSFFAIQVGLHAGCPRKDTIHRAHESVGPQGLVLCPLLFPCCGKTPVSIIEEYCFASDHNNRLY